MKNHNLLKRALMLTALLPACLSSWAYSFEVDGIYYSTSGSNVSVTYKDTEYNSYSGDVVIPETVTYDGKTYTVNSIGRSAFSDCDSLTSVTIPNSVTSIESSAFYGCSELDSVNIPGGVKTIEGLAFYECSSLSSVNISEGVKTIGADAFEYCTSLTSITLPESVESIGGYAFCHCSKLTSLAIPDGVTQIEGGTFDHCDSLISVNIPDGVKSIGMFAFSDCTSLVSVTIPESVDSIGSYAFSHCKSLTSITIPESVTRIENSTFDVCSSLVSVNIPEGVTYIGERAFADCKMTSLTIPDAVTEIGSQAFYYCYKMTSVSIGSSVIEIGDRAFETCNSLSEIISLAAVPPVIASGTFAYVDKDSCVLIVPQGSETDYSSAYYWSEFFNNIVVGVSTNAATDLTFSSATLCGQIAAEVLEPSDQGFEYGTTEELEDAETVSAEIGEDGAVSAAVAGLTSATQYYCRAYAVTELCTIYGETLSFVTEDAGIEGITADPSSATEVARYDLNGRLLSEPQEGVNIVRYSDGTAEKIMVK